MIVYCRQHHQLHTLTGMADFYPDLYVVIGKREFRLLRESLWANEPMFRVLRDGTFVEDVILELIEEFGEAIFLSQ